MAEPSTQTDPTPAEPTTPPAADTTPSSAAPVDTQKVASDAQAELLKSLGFDNKDDLQSLVDAHNKEVAANQTELEAKSGELDKATAKLSKAESERDNAQAQVAALKQGVDSDHLNDALALAKTDLAGKVNGVKTIDDALAGVLERNPSFKGEQGATGTAVANQNLGGGTPIAVPDLSKISYEEAAKLKLEHPDTYKQAVAKLSN